MKSGRYTKQEVNIGNYGGKVGKVGGWVIRYQVGWKITWEKEMKKRRFTIISWSSYMEYWSLESHTIKGDSNCLTMKPNNMWYIFS